MSNTTKKILISTGAVLLILLIIMCSFFIYASIYYKADDKAQEALKGNDLVTVEFNSKKDYYAFIPKEEYTSGFIFIPGGKVEATAYAPLMLKLAEEGVLCVLLKVNFNLAIVDQNAPKGIKEDFAAVEKWSIGGHSLGGTVSTMYLSKHKDEFAGLVLLGSYPSVDLSDTNVDCVVIYGANDNVMNMDKFEKSESYLPALTTIHKISGGNHAQFGSYGPQKGDGQATISQETQIDLTAVYALTVLW